MEILRNRLPSACPHPKSLCSSQRSGSLVRCGAQGGRGSWAPAFWIAPVGQRPCVFAGRPAAQWLCDKNSVGAESFPHCQVGGAESTLLSEAIPRGPPLIRSPLPDAFCGGGYLYCSFPSLTPGPLPEFLCSRNREHRLGTGSCRQDCDCI